MLYEVTFALCNWLNISKFPFFLSNFSDSLRYTSALSVGLAVVFVAITAGVTIVKMLEGTIKMPPLFPELVDQAAFWKLFTTIPILVTAYICHHNGKLSISSSIYLSYPIVLKSALCL